MKIALISCTEMILGYFLWGIVLLRGELRKYAKNLNVENFETALYSASVSMPLMDPLMCTYSQHNFLTLFMSVVCIFLASDVALVEDPDELEVYGKEEKKSGTQLTSYSFEVN